ncbi:MAG: OmpH family outer membrane protein [Fimbriimonadaceae bacterium]|nr:OmpH family outer membrane protein [Fimbriimonadaceae bacterium]
MKVRLVVTLALAAWITTAAAAADAVKIGKLDGEKVFQEYKLYKQLNEELQAMGRRLLADFDERKRRHPLLLDEEWSQYSTLKGKGAQRNPTEQQAFDRLSKLSDDRDRQITELEGKPKLSDDESKTWKALVGMRTQAAQDLQRMFETIQKQGQDRARELESKLTEEIRKAVEKVATQRGLSVVLQAEVIVFGGEDITADTIKLLNEAPVPPALTPTGPAPKPNP